MSNADRVRKGNNFHAIRKGTMHVNRDRQALIVRGLYLCISFFQSAGKYGRGRACGYETGITNY